MLHGLFHAFIPFAEYERLTGGKWGTGGCRCRQCARRAPRVLEFALADDVKNSALERGARRALVGLFGEGWCTQEFASLPQKIRESVLKGVGKRTTPLNAFPLLFAAEHALIKLGNSIEPWADIVREMVFAGRKGVDELLCKESEPCFSSEEWMEIMESDGVRFEDGERVEWAMAAIMRGVKESYAPSLYQTLVSSILLRPHPTEVNAPLLPATSHVRVQVEQARLELLKWIGKRWLAIRQERGFDPLEGWALKEISDHIEVPIDDLLSPPSYSSPKKRQTGLLLRPMSNHPHTSKVDAESDVASSMRVSVLSRSVHTRPGTSANHERDGAGSSASSVRSVARSTTSVASTASTSTVSAAPHVNTGGMSPARRIASEVRAGRALELKDRPDSKLTPSSSSVNSRTPSPRLQLSIIEPDVGEQEEEGEQEGGRTPEASEDGEERPEGSQIDETESIYQTPPPPLKKTLITRASLASVSSRTSTRTGTSPSVKSKATTASVKTQPTVRKPTMPSSSASRTSPAVHAASPRPNSRGSTTSTLRSRLNVGVKPGTSPTSRPTSRVSTRSISGGARPTSSVSTTDNTGTYRTASNGLSTPTTRSRRTSAASTTSVRAGGGRSNTSSPVHERARRISGASVSSVASNATSVRSTTKTAKMTPAKRTAPPVPVPDPSKLSPAAAAGKPMRPSSIKSSLSNSSTTSLTPKRVVPVVAGSRKLVSGKKSTESLRPSLPETSKIDTATDSEKENKTPPIEANPVPVELPPPANTASTITIRPNIRNDILVGSDHKKTSSSASSSSVATLRRKGSNDTIKTVQSSALSATSGGSSKQPQGQPLQQQQAVSPLISKHAQGSSMVNILAQDVPQGATLEIGIPCIISSKRKRFKAYARYIGEVVGETGPWVGVEVPMPLGDSWGGEEKPSDDRQWNDGSWGGIRYFEMGGMGSEWEYGDDRAARRRRVDAGSVGGAVWGKDKGVLKREGDQLSISSDRMKRMRSVSPAASDMSGTESRGLFVRPQQVLYVVDAVGSDL
ncbi:hypothetical protein BDZ97DRAFT_1928178 [Flammula alnicola]|nr:hypothetical protein BDZ97DRAFT_1928178 [Flammula alnicola]